MPRRPGEDAGAWSGCSPTVRCRSGGRSRGRALLLSCVFADVPHERGVQFGSSQGHQTALIHTTPRKIDLAGRGAVRAESDNIVEPRAVRAGRVVDVLVRLVRIGRVNRSGRPW